MPAPTMSRRDEVLLIDFGDDENQTTEAWAAAMHDLLDEVEATDGPRALVTTGSAKHYSNGLDVEYMSSVGGGDRRAYVARVLAVVERIMLLGVPTVAAVNGHAFGMGAFLVIAHDQAVMREDRGYLCFPEVHLGMAFSEPLMAVVRGVLAPRRLRTALATGHRYAGPEAVDAGMVDATASRDELVDAAVGRARPLAPTAGPTLAAIKRQLFPEIAARSVEARGSGGR